MMGFGHPIVSKGLLFSQVSMVCHLTVILGVFITKMPA